MGGDFIRDAALLHIFGPGQAQMLRRRNIAQETRAPVGRGSCANGGNYVVITGEYIRNHRAQDIERRTVANRLLALHVHLDLVERHMAGAFDHHLHSALAGTQDQLAKHVKFGKLCRVGGVGQTARPPAVAQ